MDGAVDGSRDSGAGLGGPRSWYDRPGSGRRCPTNMRDKSLNVWGGKGLRKKEKFMRTKDLRYDSKDSREMENGSFSFNRLR